MGKKSIQPCYVLGVGMTKFLKPRGKVDYTELGFEAGVKAMLDAHINYDDVDQGIACYCYGDSTCGQRVFYQFGMTQIPIYNVNNKVCELHDCFSANEIVTLDALGLCEKGKAHEMVRKGDITYGGQCVVNPSGGLISKGHPLGATGIAQCAELVWHLRGWANNRLVPNTTACLQHNVGLGGAVVCTVYKRPDGGASREVSNAEVAKITGLGYNPAVEAKGFTKMQMNSVRSKKARSEWALQDVAEKVESRF
jgi:acetyl-CoA acetyltransferase